MKVSILEDEPINILDFVSKSEYANVSRAHGEEILTFCFRMSSHYWIGMVDEDVACAWGLLPPTIMSDQAYLWLVTTDLVKEHRFAFIRHSQRQVEEMLKLYPLIVGHCDCQNEEAKRWLKWLGAEFVEPQGMKIPFRIRGKEWQTQSH